MEYLNATPVASLIFLVTLATSIYAFYNPEIYGKTMLHPYSVARKSKVFTLISSGFVHANWMHLIFNMVTFYAFAFRLEMLLGSWIFGLLYFASLILSDLPTVFKYKDQFWYNSLGASGAISGVLFSYILFDPWSKIYIFFIPIGIPAFIFGFLYLIYCFYASKNSRDNINHDAHFYGALSGLLITILFTPNIIPHFINILMNSR